MKKIFLAVLTASLFFVISCSGKKGIIYHDDGTLTITQIDKDGSAVKFNKTVDNYSDVMIVNGSVVKSKNPVNVNLAAYKGKDVFIDFSCDIKVEDAGNEETTIVWMINEVSANLPQIAKKKIQSGKWTSMSGSVFLHLTNEQNFYISASGMEIGNKTFYIKNFKLHISGEGLTDKEPAAPVNWLDAPAIKEAYKGKFDYFGIATSFRNEFERKDVARGIAHQADCITAGNEFKPDFVFAWNRPKKFTDFKGEDGKVYKVPADVPKFDGQKKYLEACKEAGVKMRGHVLVWHSQTPDWFFKEGFNPTKPLVTKEEMNARMEWYIKSLLGFIDTWEKENNNGEHIIFAWDVVNEAVADNATTTRWLRTDNSTWNKIYGDGTYIVNAFRYANRYAPKDVKLVYNDYGCYGKSKINGILNMIDLIRSAPDTRLDCIGMQSHVRIDYPSITGEGSFEDAVHKILAKGVDIQITELDIANGTKVYNPFLLKSVYKEYFEMFLRNRKTENQNGICGVTIWGVKDNGTWLNSQKEYKGHTQYPLLFNGDKDDEYWCKPAFYGVLEAAEEFSAKN